MEKAAEYRTFSIVGGSIPLDLETVSLPKPTGTKRCEFLFIDTDMSTDNTQIFVNLMVFGVNVTEITIEKLDKTTQTKLVSDYGPY